MSDELEELKRLRQKFERFEHSYIQNFKNNEIINEHGEKTLNLENTVNEENLNNLNQILHTENNENFKLNVTTTNRYRNDIVNSVIFENEEEKNLSSKDNPIRNNNDKSQMNSSVTRIVVHENKIKILNFNNDKTKDIPQNTSCISQIKSMNADFVSAGVIGINGIYNNENYQMNNKEDVQLDENKGVVVADDNDAK